VSWWTAFALTQAIEVPLYLLGMRGSALSPGWRLAAAFGASALTHPVVWFVIPELGLPFWAYFALAESFAVLAEWAYLRAFEIGRPGWLSLSANATSATVGLLLHTLG
jgi:hypothetical protein